MVGKTEVISNNNHPGFEISVIINYQFEQDHKIIFKVWNVNYWLGKRKLVGQTQTTINKLVTATNQTFVGKI